MQVFVYYNLTKKCWSIRAIDGPQRGKVLHHAKAWSLENVVFRVSEASRQQVLREQCRNVHAGVTGLLTSWQGLDELLGEPAPELSPCPGSVDARKAVTYNPYKAPTFVDRATGLPVACARWAQAPDCSPVVFAW